MPQLRQDKITGEWVIIAPHRSTRPGGNAGARKTSHEAHADHDSGCPFCPGNEEQIPPITLELNSTASPWQTRVIPNKYPAVRRLNEAPANDAGDGADVHGHHDVIIESPRHNLDLADMSLDSIGTVIETYHRRYGDIRATDQNLLPILFRNRGAGAGASLHHPHSQLIAVPLAPTKLRLEENGAGRYFETHGCCPYCDQLREEAAAADRIITQNDAYVAFVPYAASAPFEVLIVPRCHRPDFADTTAAERQSLAEILQSCLRRIKSALGDPDYNYVIRSSIEHGTAAPYLHWYLRIVPKLNQPGGFEVATGVPINPSNPENDAALLRDAA